MRFEGLGRVVVMNGSVWFEKQGSNIFERIVGEEALDKLQMEMLKARLREIVRELPEEEEGV